MAPKGAGKKTGRAAALIGAALLSSMAPALAAEVEIPGQTLIISKEQWEGRTLEVEGHDPTGLTVFGGAEQTGAENNLNINARNNYVSLFGGYYDGVNEAVPQQVNGNTINLTEGQGAWLAYDDPAKLDGSYSIMHLSDQRGRPLTVNLIAGHAGAGEAAYNTINIYGGKARGYVIAAESKKSTEKTAAARLHDNTVNLFGKADLTEASLFGAALFDDDDRSRQVFMGTDNTLNTYVKDVAVKELGGFNSYNFYLPADIRNRDVVLTVTGRSQTDISGSTLTALVPNSPFLQVGDKVNLIINRQGIIDSPSTSYLGLNSDTGLPEGENASAHYDIISEKQDESHVIVRLAAKGNLKPQTKQIPQIHLPMLVNRGGDFMAGGGADSAESAGAQVYTPFFAGTASSLRHTTGSHVTMKGFSFVLGLSKRIENERHRLLIAPMAEYGTGRYDAYLDSGTHGRGHSQYVGGGVVFRNTLRDGKFYEGSLRAGRLKSDYATDDFLVGSRRISESFRSSAPYFGGHLGLGRDLKLCEQDEQYPDRFIYYGKLFYTHTGGDDIRLTTGDAYHLSSVNSLRLRLGAKYLYNVNEIHKFYLGLAWEHEFDGAAHAEYQGLRTDTPRLRGSSGMVEVGWNYEPKGDDRFSIDLSATGWLGRQRGITGRVGLNWLF